MRKSNDLELINFNEQNEPIYKNTGPSDDQENRPLLNIINENGKNIILVCYQNIMVI